MTYALIFLVVLVFLLIWKIISLSEEKGSLKNEKARLTDVLKASNESHRRAAQVLDQLTKGQHDFYEMARYARSPRDYMQFANQLLEVDPPSERTDSGNHKKPKV